MTTDISEPRLVELRAEGQAAERVGCGFVDPTVLRRCEEVLDRRGEQKELRISPGGRRYLAAVPDPVTQGSASRSELQQLQKEKNELYAQLTSSEVLRGRDHGLIEAICTRIHAQIALSSEKIAAEARKPTHVGKELVLVRTGR